MTQSPCSTMQITLRYQKKARFMHKPHALSVNGLLTLIALPSPQSSQHCSGEAGAA